MNLRGEAKGLSLRSGGTFRFLPLLVLLLASSACGESPEAGFEAFAAHGRDGDYEAMWDRVYSPTRWQAEITLGAIVVTFVAYDDSLEVGDIVAMRGPELLAVLYEHELTVEVGLLSESAEVAWVHEDGPRALILVRELDADGEVLDEAIIPMHREDRQWKVDGTWVE